MFDSHIARSDPAYVANSTRMSIVRTGGKETMFDPMQGDVGANGEHRRHRGPTQLTLAGEYADGRRAP